MSGCTLNKPHRVVNNIHTVSTSDLKNLFLPPWFCVVDEIVRAGIFLDCIELCP